MTRKMRLTHEFVDYIPNVLEEGKVYVCVQFATVVHKCCCGCGREVVTPLSPTDWQLAFDGETISLYPSIGNWSYPCQSHYWITENRVVWARRWSRAEVEAGRAQDLMAKAASYGRSTATTASTAPLKGARAGQPTDTGSSWSKLKRWLF
jgi:hypothetical protein